MPRLADLTWPEAGRLADAGALLVVPVGSTEQHGPHLPISTDADMAEALALHLADTRPDVVAAPLFAYGSSGEHAAFPGTISIGQEATEFALVELCRSATMHFRRVLLVSAHGGNDEPVRRAVRRLQDERRDVRAWMARYEGDPHAGRAETSLQLFLSPGRVRIDLAEPGDTRPLYAIIDLLREGGVAVVSANGVLGDPTTASAAEGGVTMRRLNGALAELVDAWSPPGAPPGGAES